MGRGSTSAGVAPRIFLLVACFAIPLLAQDDTHPVSAGAIAFDTHAVSNPQPTLTTHDKWNNFVHETIAPITPGAGAFNAVFSQLTQTDPQYGKGSLAFAKRYGASMADIVTENFFGDFVVASAFHEDPRYHRKGLGHSLVYRAAYAISRALVIRKDTGGTSFNFDNVLGGALSTGFSNLYYPAPSRTGNAILSHFAIDVADNGLVNLAPEFWPDFRDHLFRRHHHDRPPGG